MQMLLVAFSRRMCCSRVCSASRSAGRPPGVDRHADEAAGQRCACASSRVAMNAGVRAAEAERHAEALRRARRRRRRPAPPAGAAARARAGRPRPRRARPARARARRSRRGRGARRSIPGTAAARRRRPRPGRSVVGVADDDLDAERLGPRRARRRSSAGGSRRRRRTSCPPSALRRWQHRHRLGRRGRLVEQRRVGDLHAGEVADHRLEVEERLEPALGDLGLVRRVRRVPGRVLEHVAQDHGRRDRAGVAHADERGEHLVARRRCRRRRSSTSCSLSRGRQVERLCGRGSLSGTVAVDQLVERGEAERRASSPARRASGPM